MYNKKYNHLTKTPSNVELTRTKGGAFIEL